VFTRGLLSELALRLEGWPDIAAQALAVWPLERVVITDIPGLTFWIDAPNLDNPQWKLTAAFTVQHRRPRRRGILARLNDLLGGEEPPAPMPVGRWTAERSYPDRAALARSSREAWPVLFDEIRTAAGITAVAGFGQT
jgi:hypothetical protein